MRYLIFVAICVLFFQCKKDTKDIEYTNFGEGIVVTSLQERCPTCSFVQMGYGLDLNKDGMLDFTIIISHLVADGIYTKKNAFNIFIESDNGNSADPNNFSTIIATDRNLTVHNSYNEPLADLEDYGKEPLFNDLVGHLNAWIYKVDDYDNITVEGNHYIGLKLKDKNGNNYYGWVQIRIEYWKVIIKDFAFCNTPNQMIKCGQLE